MKKLFNVLFVGSIFLSIFVWCNSQDKINIGDNISIVYTATFSNGEIFEQNTEKSPLIFTVWEGQVVKWLDEAVVGLKIGKKKKITLSPEKTYGSLYNQNMIQKVDILIFNKLEIIPEEGKTQQLDNLTWIIRGNETDEYGNEFVLFDINPKQTRDTLTYNIHVLAKQLPNE